MSRDKPDPQDDSSLRRTPSIVSASKDWRGLVTNSDPNDLPPAASPDLMNAAPIRPGELRCRGGARLVTFDQPRPV